MEIKATIDKYLNRITLEEFARYTSWDNCYKSFSASTQTDIHALELAFYLASWGMYRGSGGLLQKNHLIHKGAVDIIFKKEWQNLKCNSNNEVTRKDIKDILELKKELYGHYRAISFTKSNGETKQINPTDTLLSKVMLGTLACTPAYDRFFLDGLKRVGLKHNSLNAVALNELFDFIDKHKQNMVAEQKRILIETNVHYPLMKIVDMYFWQIGFDNDTSK